MAHIECVGDQMTRCVLAEAHPRAELNRCELPNQRGARTAQPHGPLSAGQHVTRLAGGGRVVQVGEVRREHEQLRVGDLSLEVDRLDGVERLLDVVVIETPHVHTTTLPTHTDTSSTPTSLVHKGYVRMGASEIGRIRDLFNASAVVVWKVRTPPAGSSAGAAHEAWPSA